MRVATQLSSVFACTLALTVGCAMESSEPGGGSGDQTIADEDLVKPEEGKADSSYLAVFLEFEFEGEVLLSSTWNLQSAIEDQMLYTIGHLNGDNSVGRLDHLQVTPLGDPVPQGDKQLYRYKAKLPVAWGKRNAVPTTYKLRLPRDGTFSGYEAFTEKYKHDCVDWGAHDVTSGSMWYYYRPFASSCRLDDADVFTATATVKPSQNTTTGKYPEYNKVWEDNTLRVVAIFGKYEDGATSNSDAGIAAYNEFFNAVKGEIGSGYTTVPATVPSSPGVATPDIEFNQTLADGKTIVVNMLLVDNVRTAGAVFDDRYESLSTDADFIVYNGHAGLGANVRALAQKGKWKTGQYVLFFENGCDTYAYVESALWQAHAAVNPDDPTGTKHVDVVFNAMPAYFASDSEASMAFFRALKNYAEPKSYENIFKEVDSAQVVLVTGEEDNTFVPGGGGGGGGTGTWPGMNESGTVAKAQEVRFQTPTLAPGTYKFDMTGTSDADLYVRIGSAPSKTTYDCRPYRAGSKESCTVNLSAEAPIHVMVRGWATSSTFKVVGARQ